MDDPHYWWDAYGYFSPGEHNLPCLGEVILYYFTLSKLSKTELAGILECTERYVEMLKSPANKEMPQLLPRRILLARILHIPPVLLGLSSVTLTQWGSGESLLAHSPGIEMIASPETISFYERMLALGWELYYTSSVQKAADSIRESFKMLDNEAKNATGVRKDQYDALQCRFYQLSALIARDRAELDTALADEEQAIAIAFRLKNAELIASSLLRRARIYIGQGQYQAALEDAITALPYADLARDPLKGKCYQMAGEAQAYLAEENKILQEKSLAYFDKAGHIARKGNLEPDGSFVKTDLTSIYIERAKALTLFRRFREAHHAFSIARKNLSPELTRWQMNLLIEEAKTYFAEGDVTSCCYCLLDALPVVRALGQPKREEVIHRLFERCKQKVPQDEVVRQLEKVFSASAPVPSSILPM